MIAGLAFKINLLFFDFGCIDTILFPALFANNNHD
jgi:hypothetical protein